MFRLKTKLPEFMCINIGKKQVFIPIYFIVNMIKEERMSEEKIKHILEKYKDMFEAFEEYDKTGKLIINGKEIKGDEK